MNDVCWWRPLSCLKGLPLSLSQTCIFSDCISKFNSAFTCIISQRQKRNIIKPNFPLHGSFKFQYVLIIFEPKPSLWKTLHRKKTKRESISPQALWTVLKDPRSVDNATSIRLLYTTAAVVSPSLTTIKSGAKTPCPPPLGSKAVERKRHGEAWHLPCHDLKLKHSSHNHCFKSVLAVSVVFCYFCVRNGHWNT